MEPVFARFPLPQLTGEPIPYPCGDDTHMLLYKNADEAAVCAYEQQLTARYPLYKGL